jgi:hypothetical protein
MSATFPILMHKVFVYQMLSSCRDGMPIGNQRYVKEHVSIEDQTPWAASQR